MSAQRIDDTLAILGPLVREGLTRDRVRDALEAAWMAGASAQVGPWRTWARELLARCARAENRIRADFDPEGKWGTQPEERIGAPSEDHVPDYDEALQELVESWALGNLSARQAALKAALDLEQERTRTVAEFASAGVSVRALSGPDPTADHHQRAVSGLMISAGRIRLALTRSAAENACGAMRVLLGMSS